MSARLSAWLRAGLFWSSVALILAYMTIPALVVLMTSVSPSELLEFPPSGFSLRWYERALSYPDFQGAFVNGLIVTAFASSLSLLMGIAMIKASTCLPRFGGNGTSPEMGCCVPSMSR